MFRLNNEMVQVGYNPESIDYREKKVGKVQ